MLIPGTTEHQVLSWEVAEQIVALDLTRSGLLHDTMPTQSTGPINDTPSFRSIPPMIYNGLPDVVKDLIGTPPGPSATDVPIPSDGEGTVLHLADALAVLAGSHSVDFTVGFQQVIPRPFCASGPFDLLLVQGPVEFRKMTEVGAAGQFTYREHFAGVLEAIPVDMTSGSPVPIGEPFTARVLGHQDGLVRGLFSRVSSFDRRITFDGHRAEWIKTQLHVTSRGSVSYRDGTHCVE